MNRIFGIALAGSALLLASCGGHGGGYAFNSYACSQPIISIDYDYPGFRLEYVSPGYVRVVGHTDNYRSQPQRVGHQSLNDLICERYGYGCCFVGDYRRDYRDYDYYPRGPYSYPPRWNYRSDRYRNNQNNDGNREVVTVEERTERRNDGSGEVAKVRRRVP